MSSSSGFQYVCKVADIPEGAAKMVAVNDRMIGVYHVNGKFYALANECPHAGASLAHGIIEGDTVSCRIHHWRFSICSGMYLDEETDRYDLGTFEIRVEGDDVSVRTE
ncbi:MAG: 3-phenylpropionate/trans-cinnamate dioxygenase ferredoxin subunit [Pirellulaceae bacterium]|jgi:3-phenylpropionate/trans-cinnamate dioxygenase ferredoxin subunit